MGSVVMDVLVLRNMRRICQGTSKNILGDVHGKMLQNLFFKIQFKKELTTCISSKMIYIFFDSI